jgi:hypothetical protein
MPIGCQLTLWAKDFDASSFDDCTPADELLFSFSGDTYQPSKVFDETNIPAFGVETSINIWVADGGTDDNCNGVISWDERNKDFCTTTILFTDNSGHCGGSGPIIYEGVLITQDHEPIESVKVTLETNEEVVYSTITGDDGRYALIFTPIDGQRYRIIPERDDQHKNGVSTLDLVEIQKHLLGKDPFTTPYEYIAADATNNQTVSAIDLIELRKLILGIYTKLPNNQSWRFVDPAAAIVDLTNPWPFVEIINIQYNGTTASGLDFIGVKIGDINGTAQANATQILPRSGGRRLTVEAAADAVKQIGESVNVEFTIPEALAGFQWTLETRGLQYQGISSEDIAIGDEHIGLLKDGLITMSWNQTERSKANDKKEIKIVMRFSATEEGNPVDMIKLSSKVTHAEAYTFESEILDVKLGHRSSEIVKEFALYQNEPNPWNGLTQIRFDLPEAGNVKLTLFDASGKQIRMIEKSYEAGTHSIELSRKDISATGVIYYRLDSGTYSATKKMIRIE